MAATRRKRTAAPPCWQPNARQAQILRDLAHVYEVLYAGQVGGGKTDLVAMAPLCYSEYTSSPHFKGLILRHESYDLDKEIVPRTQRLDMYPAYLPGIAYNANKRIWVFPSKGRVVLTHAKDLLSHWGPEYQYLGFDELTHFTEEQYTFLLGRLRSSVGLPIRVRAGTNPPGPGRAWVKARWGPWIDRHYLTPPADATPARRRAAESLAALLPPRQDASGRPLPPAVSGQVLWYAYDDDGAEIWVPEGTPRALSRAWVECRTDDNPALMAGDPMYGVRLQAMGSILAQQLGGGDWDVEELPGDFFQRTWFPVQELPPANLVAVVRRWDFAWTKKQRSDWSTGVKFGWTADGHYYVLHVVRDKGKLDEVRRLVQQTAKTDQADRLPVKVILPIDFSAGIYVEQDLVAALAGHQVEGVQERGEKDVRIATLQPQAQAGYVHLVVGDSGGWIPGYLDEAQAYRPGRHGGWDQLDATAGAFLHACEKNGTILTPAQAEKLREAQQRIAAAGKNYDASGWGRMQRSTWGRNGGSSWRLR